MSETQPGFSKVVIWAGAAIVIVLGFVVLPGLIWFLPFRWLSWPRWVLIPMCTVGTLGYFLAAWQALQWLSRSAQSEQPELALVEGQETEPPTQRGGQAAREVYEEILREEEDPEIREVVQEALDRTQSSDVKMTK